jgi:hypothetical protein
MITYIVQWNYKSHMATLAKGDEVQFDEEKAAWFNRDCPGVLVEKIEEAVETQNVASPPKDRMVKTAKRRGAKHE